MTRIGKVIMIGAVLIGAALALVLPFAGLVAIGLLTR